MAQNNQIHLQDNDPTDLEGIPLLKKVSLSSEQVLLPYQDLFASFEEAFRQYATLEEEAFLEELLKIPESKTDKIAPDFLNISFEDLFNIPVAENTQKALSIEQSEIDSGVSSLAQSLIKVDSAKDDSLMKNNMKVQSTRQEVFFNNTSSTETISVAPTPIESEDSPNPTAPNYEINPAKTSGVISTLFLSEKLLNTYKKVLFEGNINILGNSDFGYQFNGASFGPGALGNINAYFHSVKTGEVENRSVPEKVTLTTPEGNSLTFYISNTNEHRFGDFIYTLNNPIFTPPKPIATFDNYQGYVDKFVYAIANNFGNVAVGSLNFDIVNDAPVAQNQQGSYALLEADISTIGSSLHLIPARLVDSLVTPFTPLESFTISPSAKSPILPEQNLSYIGANGGSVTAVTLDSIIGATADGINEINGKAPTFGNIVLGQGFDISNVGHPSIEVNDTLGNTLVVDAKTGQYVYTLNKALHHSISDDSAEILFNYQFSDTEGQTAEAKLTITVNDDGPIAVAVPGTRDLQEANLENGTQSNNIAKYISGNLISATASRFGADGGSVTDVRLTSAMSNQISNLPISGAYTLSTNSGIFTVTDWLGNTLIVHPNGSYVYTLNAPFQNVNDQSEEIVYTYTLTDNDGSTASSTLTLTIKDDAPVAVSIDGGTLNEANLIFGSAPIFSSDPLILTGNIISSGSQFGADTGTITEINSKTAVAGNISASDQAGNILEMDAASGSYTYTFSHALTHHANQPQIVEFNYVLTDADGSQASNKLTFTIIDDAPIAEEINNAFLSEANLPLGSNAGGGQTVFVGNIVSSSPVATGFSKFGADGGVISEISGQSLIGGETIVLDVFGNSLQVFADGSYSFALTHPATNENNQPYIQSFPYTVEDGDGSTASNILKITIGDDAPIAVFQDGGEVFESAILDGISNAAPVILTGTLISPTTSIFGADNVGAAITEINGQSAQLGVITTDDIAGNLLVVNPTDGSYIYTISNTFTHTDSQPETVTFNYTLTDSDGSTASNSLEFTIVDDSNSGAGLALLQIQDVLSDQQQNDFLFSPAENAEHFERSSPLPTSVPTENSIPHLELI